MAEGALIVPERPVGVRQLVVRMHQPGAPHRTALVRTGNCQRERVCAPGISPEKLVKRQLVSAGVLPYQASCTAAAAAAAAIEIFGRVKVQCLCSGPIFRDLFQDVQYWGDLKDPFTP